MLLSVVDDTLKVVSEGSTSLVVEVTLSVTAVVVDSVVLGKGVLLLLLLLDVVSICVVVVAITLSDVSLLPGCAETSVPDGDIVAVPVAMEGKFVSFVKDMK